MTPSPRAVRVCVVSPLYHPELGGLGRQAQLLTEALRNAGVQLFVLARRMEGMPEAGFSPDVAVRRVWSLYPRRHNLEDVSLKNVLISLSFSLCCSAALTGARRQYDLVHFHGASIPLFVALPILIALRKKVVAKVAAGGLGTEAGDLTGRYGGLGSALAHLLRRVHAFVATSDEIRSGLLRDGIDPERIHRLGNFVDLERFRPPREGERAGLRRRLGLPEGPVVLFSGRLVGRKGAAVALHAWAKASRKHPDALLVLLGDGPELETLRRQAAAFGLVGRVSFRGSVPNPEAFLRASDVFILPSFHEGMPNSLLEALASGLPAVASRIGGVVDVAADADGGVILVEAGEPEELARELTSLLADEGRRRNLADAGARCIRDRYSLHSRVSAYVALYERLLGGA